MIQHDLSEAAANAVITWISSNAEKSNKYKIEGLSVTFKATFTYRIFGYISTLIGIGCLFLPHIFATFVLSGIFGTLGILILLYGYVMRLTLDPERITYRGPFGVKKEILWQDVRSVAVVSEYGDIMVTGRDTRIPIFEYLDGTADIKKLLLSRFPSSFDPEAVIAAGNSRLFEKEYGSYVFKPKKLSVVVGFVMVVFSLIAVITGITITSFRDGIGVISIYVFLASGILLLLYGFVIRLYIDDEKLAYRTLFGHEKAIRWEDIQSVTVCGEPQHELIKVSSATTRIRIRIDFKGYQVIKALVLIRCPQKTKSKVVGRPLLNSRQGIFK